MPAAVTSAVSDSPPPYGTIAFDCDSTLCSIEGVDELARLRPQLCEHVQRLTSHAMNGELALEHVYRARLEALRPDLAALEQLGRAYAAALAPHARELVAALHALEKRVAIVSGGLRIPVLHVARQLGIPEELVHAVEVFHDRAGNYAGFDESSPLARCGGKLELARALAASDRRGGLAFVGDGTTDLEAAPAARRFVAFAGFAARPAVLERAAAATRSHDFAALVPWLLAPHERQRLAEVGGHDTLLAAARSAS